MNRSSHKKSSSKKKKKLASQQKNSSGVERLSTQNKSSLNTTEQNSAHDVDRKIAYNELVTALKSVGGVSNNFAENLANNWKRLLGTAFLLLFGVWLAGSIRQEQRQKQAQEADQFIDAQNYYTEAFVSSGDVSDTPSKAEAEPAEAEQNKLLALHDRLELLDKSGSGNIYNKLTGLYLSVIHFTQGNIALVREKLLSYNINKYQNLTAPSVKDEKLSQTFIDELAALTYIRTLISDPGGAGERANIAEARERLMGLSYSSRLVTVEAVITLYRISATKSDREQVMKVANDLMRSRPELKDMLTQEFLNLGVSLGSVNE